MRAIDKLKRIAGETTREVGYAYPALLQQTNVFIKERNPVEQERGFRLIERMIQAPFLSKLISKAA